MVKTFGRVEKCESCGRGKITFSLFTGKDNPYSESDMTKEEIKRGGIISGNCDTCGFCCGKTQDS